MADVDLRFWGPLEGGEAMRGEPDLRSSTGRAGHDLATVVGPANVAQALIHRLLTRVGELADLGHPDYGSRLHLLIGERATLGNRRLVKLFILEALSQEPRILTDRIRVEVRLHPSERTAVVADITVEPADKSGPLQFEFPYRF